MPVKQEPTIVQAAATAYAMQHKQLIRRRINMNKLAQNLAILADDQQRRMDDERPVSPIPLIWVALAQTVGLTIDIETGRITDGPKDAVTIWSNPTTRRALPR